ncbi:diheme cytochrome c [Propionivibrio sp.]|uniref:diheme cytochrome c n=1 Tax=Propionivibrio sp. TaxID=2212460 RepID=UPI003BF081DC
MKAIALKIPFRPIVLGLVVLFFSGILLERAQAGGGYYYPPVADPVVREECGGCHLAFPASMLPKRSWTRMMGDLKNHFGDDASLDAATTERIARYLDANAADSGGQRYGGKLIRGVSLEKAPLRITELPKWVREHREITSAEWKAKEVGSKANCVACHTDAERGYYDE